MIRVAICDDHEMVREALAGVIALEQGIEVVGATSTMDTTMDLVDKTEPDILVVDVRLENESGLDVARSVVAKHPKTKIVVLTSFNSDEALVQAYELGASAFILKAGSADVLVRTIRDAAAGLRLINPAEVRAAAGELDKKGIGIIRELDANDRQIARLISLGYSDKQIAETVFLGLQTVRNRVSRLLSRFNKENRTQLALFFAEYQAEMDDI
ncbi:MAG: response regulator transcription factor [Actinomycetes bacterium]